MRRVTQQRRKIEPARWADASPSDTPMGCFGGEFWRYSQYRPRSSCKHREAPSCTEDNQAGHPVPTDTDKRTTDRRAEKYEQTDQTKHSRHLGPVRCPPTVRRPKSALAHHFPQRTTTQYRSRPGLIVHTQHDWMVWSEFASGTSAAKRQNQFNLADLSVHPSRNVDRSQSAIGELVNLFMVAGHLAPCWRSRRLERGIPTWCRW